jgi:two-component system nitrogen regulation response regulator NtrX
LRERLEDISMLLCHFLKLLKMEISLETDAIDILVSHDWPGNVRELKNLAERIAVMHQGPSITADDLKKLLNKRSKKPQNTGNPLPEGIMERNYNEAKDSFEKCYLEFQLLKNNGIITRTAEAIGIYPSNLHAKLRKYNVNAANIKEET